MGQSLSVATVNQPVFLPEDEAAGTLGRAGALARKFARAAAPVITGAGIQYAFKTAAVGTALAAGANVYGAAIVGGGAVTAVGAVRDFRRFRAAQDDRPGGFLGAVRDFFRFLGGRKKEYGTKLLKNTGLAALGAGIAGNLDSIGEAAGKALDFVKERVSGFSLIPEAQAAKTAMIAPDAHPAEPAITKTAPEGPENNANAAEKQPPAEPAPDDFGTALQALDTKGWNARALEDLKAAQAGKAWAIQNIAHYAANGLQGVPKDLGLARIMAEEGASRNYRLSVRFLDDLNRIAGSASASPASVTAAPTPAAPPAHISADVPAAADVNDQPVSNPVETPDGVVIGAVQDAAPLVMTPLESLEKDLPPYLGRPVARFAECRESFRDATTGAIAYDCEAQGLTREQMEPREDGTPPWFLAKDGAVIFHDSDGTRTPYINGDDKPVQGPAFMSFTAETHLNAALEETANKILAQAKASAASAPSP